MKSLPGVGMETPKLWSVCWIHAKADHVKQGRPSPNVLPSEENSVCEWSRYAAENKNERHPKRTGRVGEKHLFPILQFLDADHGRQDPCSAKEFWQIPLKSRSNFPFLPELNFSCSKPNGTYFYYPWPRQKMDSYTWETSTENSLFSASNLWPGNNSAKENLRLLRRKLFEIYI